MDHKQIRAGFIAASIIAFALPIEAFAMPKPMGSLESQATVQRAPAEKAALAIVPNGTVKSGKLERMHGKLVWAFDVTSPRSWKGTEVVIDAKNGKILEPGIKMSHRHHYRHYRHHA